MVGGSQAYISLPVLVQGEHFSGVELDGSFRRWRSLLLIARDKYIMSALACCNVSGIDVETQEMTNTTDRLCVMIYLAHIDEDERMTRRPQGRQC